MPSLTLQIKVKPQSRMRKLTVADDGPWSAHLKSPPVDGKANEELIALVAEHFGRPRGAVTLKSGAGARLKWLKVDL
jgi:uncharacterized protein